MFANLFSNTINGAAFEAAIKKDASSGRINNEFRAALCSAYGIELDTKPFIAIKAINRFLALDKAPKLTKGVGARAAAPQLAQALHALASAILAGGKVKNLPILASLPAWADPETLAASAEKRAEKRAAAAAEKRAADASDIFNATMSAIKSGQFTEAQLLELRNLLQGETLRVTRKAKAKATAKTA